MASGYPRDKSLAQWNLSLVPACLVKTRIWPHFVYYNLRQSILCSDKSTRLVSYHNLASHIKIWDQYLFGIYWCSFCSSCSNPLPVQSFDNMHIITFAASAGQYLGHNIENSAQYLLTFAAELFQYAYRHMLRDNNFFYIQEIPYLLTC